MVRKGRFARLNGKEYALISFQHQYYLKSNDRSDIELGFEERQENAGEFIKKVSIENLEDAYEIFPFSILKGHRFAIEGQDKENGTIKLVTSNPFVSKKVAVRPYGKDEYIIELPHDQVVIEEDRIQILGFEMK